jgi:hypothetical protein
MGASRPDRRPVLLCATRIHSSTLLVVDFGVSRMYQAVSGAVSRWTIGLICGKSHVWAWGGSDCFDLTGSIPVPPANKRTDHSP